MIDVILDFFQNAIITLSKAWNFLTTPIVIPLGTQIGAERLSTTPLMLLSSSAIFVILTIIIIKGVIS